MATSTFPTLVTGVTVQAATTGALSGDGSANDKLAVGVDGTTIDVNGSNQLAALGAAVSFKTIAVSGQSNIVADSATDTLTVVAGDNITLTTNASTDTLTVTAAAGGASPAGAATELQYRADASTFGAAASDYVTAASAFTLPHGFAMTVPAPDISLVVPPSLPMDAPGDVTNGVHRFKFTYATSLGETLPSVATDPVTVVDNAVSGQIVVPIPQYPQEATFVTALNLYMTKAGGSTYYLALTTTDYSEQSVNVADADLTVLAPTVSTAVGVGYAVVDDGVLVPPYGTSYNDSVITLRSVNGFVWIQSEPTVTGSANITINPGLAQYGTNAGTLNLTGGYSNSGTGGSLFLGAGYGGAAKGAVHVQDGDFTDRIVIGPSGTIALTPPATVTVNGSLTVVKAVSSVTSVTTTATVNTTAAHLFTTGQTVTIAGGTGDSTPYNGPYTITVTDADTFHYTFAGSTDSPAEGTFTASRVVA